MGIAIPLIGRPSDFSIVIHRFCYREEMLSQGAFDAAAVFLAGSYCSLCRKEFSGGESAGFRHFFSCHWCPRCGTIHLAGPRPQDITHRCIMESPLEDREYLNFETTPILGIEYTNESSSVLIWRPNGAAMWRSCETIMPNTALQWCAVQYAMWFEARDDVRAAANHPAIHTIRYLEQDGQVRYKLSGSSDWHTVVLGATAATVPVAPPVVQQAGPPPPPPPPPPSVIMPSNHHQQQQQQQPPMFGMAPAIDLALSLELDQVPVDEDLTAVMEQWFNSDPLEFSDMLAATLADDGFGEASKAADQILELIDSGSSASSSSDSGVRSHSGASTSADILFEPESEEELCRGTV